MEHSITAGAWSLCSLYLGVPRCASVCLGVPIGVGVGVGVKRYRFVRVTLIRERISEAHFCADVEPLSLERFAFACNSGFPLPASSRLLPASR